MLKIFIKKLFNMKWVFAVAILGVGILNPQTSQATQFIKLSDISNEAFSLCAGPTPQYEDIECTNTKGYCAANYISCVWAEVSKVCTVSSGQAGCGDTASFGPEKCVWYNSDGSCGILVATSFDEMKTSCHSLLHNKYDQALSQTCSIQDKPVCGDGIVQGSEICDGTTKKSGFVLFPGELCSQDCKILSVCGDGKTDGSEICDYKDPTPLPDGKTCSSSCSFSAAFPNGSVFFTESEFHSYQVGACTNDHTKKCEEAYNICLNNYETFAVGNQNLYGCKKNSGNGYDCKTKPFDDLYKKIQDMDFSVICPNNTPPPATCGNGKVEDGEMCDEGAGNGGGNCDASCQYHASTNADTQCFAHALNVCHQQKAECEKIQGDKNCPDSFHQCLINADKHCQIAASLNGPTTAGENQAEGSTGCSMTETVSTTGSVAPVLIFALGILPLLARRMRKAE